MLNLMTGEQLTFFSGMRVLERCGPTQGLIALGWLSASSCSHWKQVVRRVKQERVSRCTSRLRARRLSMGEEQSKHSDTHLYHHLPLPPPAPPTHLPLSHSLQARSLLE